MHHQEGPNGRILNQAHFQIARSAAQPPQYRIDLSRLGEQGWFLFEQAQPSGRPIRHLEHLHLANHLGWRAMGRKTTRGSGQLRHERGARDDRGFLHHHRDKYIPAVDHKVQGDPNR